MNDASSLGPWRRVGAIALGVYWIALIVALHWPQESLPTGKFVPSDKLVHALLYGGFALLLMANVDLWQPSLGNTSPRWRLLLGVFALVLVQGILDEITQPLTGRAIDLWDWAFDSLGAVIALVVWDRLLRTRLMPSA